MVDKIRDLVIGMMIGAFFGMLHLQNIQASNVTSTKINNGSYIGTFYCTAYCTEKRAHICGTGTGTTSSGELVKPDVSIAINKELLPSIPYGSVVLIEDVGIRVVEDTGGGLATNQIDVAVDTHEHAESWDLVGDHKVYLLEVENE